MSAKNQPKMTPKRIHFIKTYSEFDDSQTLKEILFAQKEQLDKLERIRTNTSVLVWFLVALPFIFGILYFFVALGL